MNRRSRRAEATRQGHAKAMTGMELRYNARTLVVTAYVNTSEESPMVLLRVRPAARGPRQVMTIVTGETLDGPQAAPLWAERGIETLFEGRTVVVTAYVNTDEEPQAISDRVMLAANTPIDPRVREACRGQLAVITTVGLAEAAEARAMWQHFFAALEARKDGPN